MSKIQKLDAAGVIDRLYEGAEFVVDETNIISVDFTSPELASCLMDDIAAILDEPGHARVAEPILREALQHIAAKILTRA